MGCCAAAVAGFTLRADRLLVLEIVDLNGAVEADDAREQVVLFAADSAPGREHRGRRSTALTDRKVRKEGDRLIGAKGGKIAPVLRG